MFLPQPQVYPEQNRQESDHCGKDAGERCPAQPSAHPRPASGRRSVAGASTSTLIGALLEWALDEDLIKLRCVVAHVLFTDW